MSSFDKSQTRKKTKRKTKATAKKVTMMTTKTTTATQSERARPLAGRAGGAPAMSSIMSIHWSAAERTRPGNMQWQTVAAGKAKDKTERNCRL